MTKTIISKSGKEIRLRSPRLGDVIALHNYVNDLVAEDALILINEPQSLSQEKQHVIHMLKEIKASQRVQLLAFHQQKLIANTQIVKAIYRMSHVGTFGISVAKNYRGDGIGGELSKTVFQLAAEKLHVQLIDLTTYSNNKPAIRMYEKLGFQRAGIIPKAVQYKNGFVDLIHMYRRLGKS